MSIFSKLGFKKNIDDTRKLIRFSIYDILIYTLCFAIMIIIISVGMRSYMNLSNVGVIADYQGAVAYTVDNNIYLSILSILLNVGMLFVFLLTITNAFRRKLLNKGNYKDYIVFIVISILLLSFVTGEIVMILAYNRLLCIGRACQVSDFSFYTYELKMFNNLYKGLAINYYVWSLLSVFICSYLIKYLYNKRITVKDKDDNFIKKIIRGANN